MLNAERTLPKKRDRVWTPDLGKLVHKTRYLKLLLQKCRGREPNKKVLTETAAKAACTWYSTSKADILRQLCRTRQDIDKHIKKEVQKQDEA